MEGGCPGSDLGVFGQHVTDVIADGIVDGVVVGAGSSVALQPTSGQGTIPAALLSQFLLSITVSWAALKKARLCGGEGGLGRVAVTEAGFAPLQV